MAAARDSKGRFVKGKSGNPNGRAPKAREEKYLDILKSTITFKDFEALVKKTYTFAMKGDAPARKWLTDYIIGPPPTKHEITGKDGDTLTINLSWGDELQEGDDKLP